jgi:MYXO-CTERM domain-containing protein
VNNWLGRSNWTGDANLDGTFNEFRIYDYALTDAQVAGNFSTGPDLVDVPELGAASLLVFGALALTRRRRAWIA